MTEGCAIDGCLEPRAVWVRGGMTFLRDVCTGHYRERCRAAWDKRRAGRGTITCPHCGRDFEEEK